MSVVLRLLAGLGGLLLVSGVAGVAGPTTASSGMAPGREPASGHQRMLALLARIADESVETHVYIGEGPARRARAALETLDPAAPGPSRWLALVRVAEEELRLGRTRASIRAYEDALLLLPETGADPSWRQMTLYRLAIAKLRLAETQNCVLHPTAESCILPLRGEAIYDIQTPSREAIAHLTELLTGEPEPGLALGARWLLNLAHMTVGGYPDDVPAPHRMPVGAFESDEDIPRFRNIAPELGLDTYDMCGGAVVDDFDGDGLLDLLVSTWDTRGALHLFRNEGDGTFSDRTDAAGLTGLYGGLNLVQADYDNDGDLDVLVLRGAWLREHGAHPNSLLRNHGDGTFTDVTFDAGLGDRHYPTQTAAWGDYDNDGDLDLYVGNETSPSIVAPSQLFRNDGDGTFTDVAEVAGVTNDRYAKAVVWGDYDGDRWLDLYVSNSEGVNRLYRNQGDGTFRDVAESLGVGEPRSSFPAWFWDVDNDGVLDLYVAAYAAGIEDLAASALGHPVRVETARLYRGTERHGFEDVTRRYGLHRPSAPMGANFGDLDNDGYLDFYLGTGYPPYHSLMPNLMYRNVGGERFADVTYAGGFGHVQKGHAVVFADLDRDGDHDVFEQMGGAFPGDRYGNVLYENPGFGHHWITVALTGVRSNRFGVGARLRVEVEDEGRSRSIYRHVNTGGSFGANPLRQTIGVGRASRIRALEVFWPASNLTQRFTNLPVDRLVEVTEGVERLVVRELEAVGFGGRSMRRGFEAPRGRP